MYHHPELKPAPEPVEDVDELGPPVETAIGTPEGLELDGLSAAERVGLCTIAERVSDAMRGIADPSLVHHAAQETVFQLALLIRTRPIIAVPDLGVFAHHDTHGLVWYPCESMLHERKDTP